jgi:hypothetical protein
VSLAGECTHVLHVAHAVEGLVAVDVRVSEHVHVSPEPPAHPPPRRGDSPSTPQLKKGAAAHPPQPELACRRCKSLPAGAAAAAAALT